METAHSVYPACNKLKSDECINFLPETLRLLLEGLIVGKRVQTKIASIGQAIMQAARPRVLLAPMQVCHKFYHSIMYLHTTSVHYMYML